MVYSGAFLNDRIPARVYLHKIIQQTQHSLIYFQEVFSREYFPGNVEKKKGKKNEQTRPESVHAKARLL